MHRIPPQMAERGFQAAVGLANVYAQGQIAIECYEHLKWLLDRDERAFSHPARGSCQFTHQSNADRRI